MLRNDAYWFSRLGVYMERADNTARILDVKYHVLLPETEQVGGSLDYFQWSTILREVSALTAYHWVYRESLKPWLVADLLILNGQMPRRWLLLREHRARSSTSSAGIWPAGALAAPLPHAPWRGWRTRASRTSSENGLHEFISGFIADNNRLGAAVAEQYLV